jgi:hypothetical protein
VNLDAPSLPELVWRDEKVQANLTELRCWGERLANDTINWYLSEKQGKARWSRALRALSAILATLGGAVPVAALAAGYPSLGNWGFVLLGLAVGAFGYDRYFGYSTAWLRYMVAAMGLRAHLTQFQLSWVREMAHLGEREATAEETLVLVEMVREFVAVVNETVRAETDSWVGEFQSRLSELESKLTGPMVTDN